jgi:hypothetical protein
MELHHLDIIPSYACYSANCIECYQKSRSDYADSCRHTLDIERLVPFLERYTAVMRVLSFGLFGGEITDYPRCVELVAMLTDAFPGIRLEIVTNGQKPQRIGRIAEAGRYRDNLIFELSIDGFGTKCDELRGKEGYFANAMRSIQLLDSCGLGGNIRINARYYPETEDSLIAMADYLQMKLAIPRSSIRFQSSIDPSCTMAKTCEYMLALRRFLTSFCCDRGSDNYQRWHPRHQAYNTRTASIFCVPGVQPDGCLYTCNNYKQGVRIGTIADKDVGALVKRMLDVAIQKPEHCNYCRFGRCVWANYMVMQLNQETLSATHSG